MIIEKDGLKAKISCKEFERLLECYTPSESIEITYYIGDYFFSIDFEYYYRYRLVSSLVCELKNAKQVMKLVALARKFGYNLTNLS